MLALTVDSGPTGAEVNRLYASVTICSPGSSTQCQTIDHVLVDTGSTGLRLLSSAMPASLNLSRLTGSTGFPLFSCAQFVDNTYAWGPVASADIVLGGLTAANVPFQIVGDPAYSALGSACSTGTPMNTVAQMGAKGILGLGLFSHDCGANCSVHSRSGFYYTCTSASCTAATGSSASTSKQLQNPVPLFSSDNNGMLVDLPAIGNAGAVSLSGSLIFGIGTRSNNQPVSLSMLTADASGYLGTVYANTTMNSSFIDTGSNGIYFESAITQCSGNAAGFYCPPTLTNLSATMVGANAKTALVKFPIDNAIQLFSASSNAVLPTLSGPSGDVTSFDWGLPFFYGRRVFSGIEGQTSTLGSGGFYAF